MQSVRKIRTQRANHNRRTRRRTATRARTGQNVIAVISRQTTGGDEHQPPNLHQLRLQGNREGRRRNQEEKRRNERGRRLEAQLLNIQGRAIENINSAHSRRDADHQAQETHARRHEAARGRHRETVNRVLHGTHQAGGWQKHNHARCNHQGCRNRFPRTLQNRTIATQPNRQEGHQARAGCHAEERRDTD